MGAENYSPPTSVDRGSDFVPQPIVNGSAAGLAEHLRTMHFAPGETRVGVIEVGSRSLPNPATTIGQLARFDDDGTAKLAISDGTAWHLLTAGEAL